MIERLWKEQFKIISPLVNPFGRLGLFGVLNLLQDTAWMHAQGIGFGMTEMEKDGLIWVFTRQKLKMREWPEWGQNISVQTWIRPPEGAFVTRNFVIADQTGKEIGESAASFLALDRKTRRIIPAVNLRPWQDLVHDRTLELVPDKIAVSGEYEKLAKYRVRNSDLDGNQHVNNTKYAQWILDSISYEIHKEFMLDGYSVNFLAETHLGDEVEVHREIQNHSPETDSGKTFYKGLRAQDGKVLFTAQLEWKKRR